MIGWTPAGPGSPRDPIETLLRADWVLLFPRSFLDWRWCSEWIFWPGNGALWSMSYAKASSFGSTISFPSGSLLTMTSRTLWLLQRCREFLYADSEVNFQIIAFRLPFQAHIPSTKYRSNVAIINRNFLCDFWLFMCDKNDGIYGFVQISCTKGESFGDQQPLDCFARWILRVNVEFEGLRYTAVSESLLSENARHCHVLTCLVSLSAFDAVLLVQENAACAGVGLGKERVNVKCLEPCNPNTMNTKPEGLKDENVWYRINYFRFISLNYRHSTPSLPLQLKTRDLHVKSIHPLNAT